MYHGNYSAKEAHLWKCHASQCMQLRYSALDISSVFSECLSKCIYWNRNSIMNYVKTFIPDTAWYFSLSSIRKLKYYSRFPNKTFIMLVNNPNRMAFDVLLKLGSVQKHYRNSIMKYYIIVPPDAAWHFNLSSIWKLNNCSILLSCQGITLSGWHLMFCWN